MSSEHLAAAVAALHAKVDAWHAVVEGVATESGHNATEALADPRLEAAQDAFYEALGAFEAAALPVLGMVVLDDATADDDQVLEDDFFVHYVVAVDEGDSPERLDEAFATVNKAGLEISDRLRSEGFLVRSFTASRGELDLDDLDEDEPR